MTEASLSGWVQLFSGYHRSVARLLACPTEHLPQQRPKCSSTLCYCLVWVAHFTAVHYPNASLHPRSSVACYLPRHTSKRTKMSQIRVFFNAFHSAFSIFQKSEALLAAGFRDNSVTWELIFLLLKKYNSLPPPTHTILLS